MFALLGVAGLLGLVLIAFGENAAVAVARIVLIAMFAGVALLGYAAVVAP